MHGLVNGHMHMGRRYDPNAAIEFHVCIHYPGAKGLRVCKNNLESAKINRVTADCIVHARSCSLLSNSFQASQARALEDYISASVILAISLTFVILLRNMGTLMKEI